MGLGEVDGDGGIGWDYRDDSVGGPLEDGVGNILGFQGDFDW